ncbi:MAG TPA: acyltransferase domain-containing protein, partial [Solirubrobacteraceae bacterium]|nr:acyltransferase domain-containing protein [Solirubrobacteraceae bacterium]
MREQLLEALSSVAPRSGTLRFYSTVTGEAFDTRELGAEYWYRNMREPVLFEPVIRGLLEDGHRTFIEISAHPVLVASAQETMEDLAGGAELAEQPAGALGTLRREQGGAPRFLTSLGEAWVRGVHVDWDAVLGEPSRRVSLPTYAFQRERYWIQPPVDEVAHAASDPGAGAEAEFWEAVESEDPGRLTDALGVPAQADSQSLAELLPTLSDWRRRKRSDSLIDGWTYRLEWKPISDRSAALSGLWLIVLPADLRQDEWTLAIVQSLRANGAQVAPVEVDCPAVADRALLAKGLSDAAGGEAPAGVLSLLSLSEQPIDGQAGLSVGLAATLALLQALEAAGIGGRLWLATREAVPVAASEASHGPLGAASWGLGNTLAVEQPHRWGGLVDLPATLEERSLGRLCRVLAGPGEEDQLAVRPAAVFARRLERSGAGQKSTAGAWAPRGTVLVTGAADGRAAHVARWLAQMGAAHVLLLGPGSSDASSSAGLVLELKQLGCDASWEECESFERDRFRELLAAIPPERPLDSVFHAAEADAVGTLDALTFEQLQVALAPTAGAALHLHELTEHMELSAFVLFSSMVAFAGAGGRGAEAVAGALLDGLAGCRRARGLPATAVAWGSWAQDAAKPGGGHPAGVLALDPQLALRALGRALDREQTHVTVADIDWDTYATTHASAHRSLIVELPEVKRVLAQSATGEDKPSAGAFALRLTSLDAPRRERVALELVRSHVAAVLGHASPDAVDTRRAFRELGFDSLMGVDLRNKLQAATGLELPPTLVFNQPTPAALARFLVAEATGESESTAPASIAVRSEEPIAIVGMGCRYPGGVRSPQELWELVAAGRDAIGEFPSDRGWDLQGLYHPDPAHRGTSYVREGGFLRDVADFDAGFFGISPREAVTMDPQQRLLLEVCWEAFEDAGLDPTGLRGTPTGIYVGSSGQDYAMTLFDAVPDSAEGYRMAGAMSSMTSGRLAYLFGLEGPAVSVDTACSSSLVALHLASQALRSGECSLAVAAGAVTMSSPLLFVEGSRQGALATDARCKAFADGADGTSFSEGVGVLVVERLSEAQRLGHEVLAVVRGSALNQDGASNGLTAPNGASQEKVIRQALANGGLAPEEVDAVEAHGTGTALGDPIEAHALLMTYGRDRPAERPLWLGSIKSNIGHSSAAAGVAGVIKMVMALRNSRLPRTLHVNRPSTQVDWSKGAISLLTEERAWETNGRPRRAGVSSFGASGTNAHVIVEEAPAPDTPPTQPEPDASPATGLVNDVVPWLLSARDGGALGGQAQRMIDHVASRPELDLGGVGRSLAGRTAFDERAVVLGDSRERLLEGLGVLATGKPGDVVRGVVRGDPGQVVFVFPGQGGQWVGMAVGLLDSSPVFARSIGECEAALAPFVDWSLEGVLRGVEGEPGLDRLDVVQPVLFAVMVSLAGLWRACGVVADVVVGHSQGEIAAACVAGALSLGDAARVVVLRSRLLMGLEESGAMMGVAAPVGRVEELVAGWGGRVVVAAVNGPGSVVVVGENELLGELVGVCDGLGISTRMIRGGGRQSHSAHVECLREELLGALDPIAPRVGSVGFCSTVTGGLLDGDRLGAEYWYRNMREPVQFEGAVRGLAEGGARMFVEVSPHPVLLASMSDTVDDPGVALVGSLRRGEGGPGRFTTSLAEAWTKGATVDWTSIFTHAGIKRVKVPSYAFQRERYWLSARAGIGDLTSAGLGSAEHPLLG